MPIRRYTLNIIRFPFFAAVIGTLWLIECQLCFTNQEIANSFVLYSLLAISIFQTALWLYFNRKWNRSVEDALNALHENTLTRFNNNTRKGTSSSCSFVPIALTLSVLLELGIIALALQEHSLRIYEFIFLKSVLLIYLAFVSFDLTSTYSLLGRTDAKDRASSYVSAPISIHIKWFEYIGVVSLIVIMALEIFIFVAILSGSRNAILILLYEYKLLAEPGRQTYIAILVTAMIGSGLVIANSISNSAYCIRSLNLVENELHLVRGAFKANLDIKIKLSEITDCWVSDRLGFCFSLKGGAIVSGHFPHYCSYKFTDKYIEQSRIGFLFGKRGRLTFLLCDAICRKIRDLDDSSFLI